MSDYALVADVGGTNARFALVRPGDSELKLAHVHTLQCDDYDGLEDACRAYFSLAGINPDQVGRACMAFACPVDGEEIRFTNNHWRVRRSELVNSLGLTELKLLNDFTAMALGMLRIPDDECLPVGEGESSEGVARLVIGPGTGLGVSGLIPSCTSGNWIPLATEGGHVSFAPLDDIDGAVLNYLQRQFGRVSVERILCGQGLLNLYQALCHIRGEFAKYYSPAAVSDSALAGDDPIAVETLRRFCRILGSVAGDSALTLGARGGVYLCGGILPRIETFFRQSDFRKAFEDKGRFRSYMERIPVWLCTADNPGLIGAAAALDNPEVGS